MLHALYIIAFTALSVLAISNLIRNLMLLGTESRRDSRKGFGEGTGRGRGNSSTPHPEMLDERGRVLEEPLLVMRSISLKDARERLDALYEGGSSGKFDDASEED